MSDRQISSKQLGILAIAVVVELGVLCFVLPAAILLPVFAVPSLFVLVVAVSRRYRIGRR